MKILIAPNAFKNGLSAEEAGESIKNGLEMSSLNADFLVRPIADGGDGSLGILSDYLGAELRSSKVRDPLGRELEANWGINQHKKTAVIELAEASEAWWD